MSDSKKVTCIYVSQWLFFREINFMKNFRENDHGKIVCKLFGNKCQLIFFRIRFSISSFFSVFGRGTVTSSRLSNISPNYSIAQPKIGPIFVLRGDFHEPHLSCKCNRLDIKTYAISRMTCIFFSQNNSLIVFYIYVEKLELKISCFLLHLQNCR